MTNEQIVKQYIDLFGLEQLVNKYMNFPLDIDIVLEAMVKEIHLKLHGALLATRPM